MQNLRSASQIYVGDFVKFCGLLRIYELYVKSIDTFALAFFGYIISVLASVVGTELVHRVANFRICYLTNGHLKMSSGLLDTVVGLPNICNSCSFLDSHCV